MKKITTTAFILLIWAGNAQAETEAVGFKQADRAREQFAIQAENNRNISYVGITTCDARHGSKTRPEFLGPKVYCVHIGAYHPNAVKSLQRQYPPGKKVNGVFYFIEKMIAVQLEPRMTGGR